MLKMYEYTKNEYERLKNTGKIQEIPLLELVKDSKTGEMREMDGLDIRMITKEPLHGHILNYIVAFDARLEFEMVHYNLRPVAIIEEGITYIVLKDNKNKFLKYDINYPSAERLEKHTRIKVQKYLSENLNEMKNNFSSSRNNEFIIHTEFNNFIQTLPKKFFEFEEIIKADKSAFEIKLNYKDIKITYHFIKVEDEVDNKGNFHRGHYLIQPNARGKDVSPELFKFFVANKKILKIYDFEKEKYYIYNQLIEYTRMVSLAVKEYFKEELEAKRKLYDERVRKWEEEQRRAKFGF